MAKLMFVSLPIKLLVIIVASLMILSVWFSSISLSRLDKEFEAYQTERFRLGQEQFKLHNYLLKDKVSVWIESVANLEKVSLEDNAEFLKPLFDNHFNTLQLHYNVENFWLVNKEKSLLYSTSHIEPYIIENIDQSILLQKPFSSISCEVTCLQVLTVPVINNAGNLIIVGVTISLVDMIYAIHQSINSDIAIVSFPKNENVTLNQVKILSASDMSIMQQILTNSKGPSTVEDATIEGIKVEYEGDKGKQSFLVHLLPLTQDNQTDYYMMLVDDVTQFSTTFEQSRRQFLFSALLIFVTLAILVYLIASPLTNRVLILSRSLPMLAKKEFDQFRMVKFKRKKYLPDELDVLADSMTDLSYQLEQLNLEINQKTKELENIAMYDVLTGLPNRNMLNFQLGKLLDKENASIGHVAVLFLDLDDFKKVNDSHGHEAGDLLLVEAASRLRLSVSRTDLACRFGGDEFVVLLNNIDSIDQAVLIAEQINAQFKKPIKIVSNLFYVTTSIGIAYFDKSNIRPEELISYADIAMYEAKSNGGGGYHIYQSEMFKRVAHRVDIEREVRQALAKNQFSLSLQPQLAAQTNEVYGFEALLRWHHPERGMIPPDDFIPILETSEHMVELGYWIIRRCFELSIELKKHGMPNARIAINLAPGQFLDANLPFFLQNLLDEFQLKADAFELELTEQTLVKDMEHTVSMMEEIRKIGFTFAIDDFGTGYSSLAYLKQLPVDVIKIDRSFVFGMMENEADYQITMSTIAMVKNLGLMVVAEGVETSAQLRCLKENKCDIIQGYYFSKPVPEVELFDFIANQISDSHWKIKT